MVILEIPKETADWLDQYIDKRVKKKVAAFSALPPNKEDAAIEDLRNLGALHAAVINALARPVDFNSEPKCEK